MTAQAIAPQYIEQGVYVQKLRRRWWQLWLPREVVVAQYTIIGDVLSVTLLCGVVIQSDSYHVCSDAIRNKP